MSAIFPDDTSPSGFQKELHELEIEMQIVLTHTKSLWPQHDRHFPYTSYGFAMCLFGRIDLFSKFWLPNEGDQTKRMVGFLRNYLRYGEKESEIAIQFWRHTLMHTASPRELVEIKTDRRYSWLLQNTLDDGHWCFQNSGEPRILNVGLFNLLSDLKAGLEKAIEGLNRHPDLTASWSNVTKSLSEFKPKF